MFNKKYKTEEEQLAAVRKMDMKLNTSIIHQKKYS